MLLTHISFALGLIALVVGVSLYLWSVRAEAGPGIALAKVVGIVVIVLAILELLCTLYSGIRIHHLKKEWLKEHGSMMMPSNPIPAPGNQPAPANNPPANATPATPAQ